MYTMQVSFGILITAAFLVLLTPSKRVYEKNEDRFLPGSEHLRLPYILLVSVYMGRVKYPHLSLLFESMRWNPTVDFVLINIIVNDTDTKDIRRVASLSGVKNFFIKEVPIKTFSDIVYEKLKIRVPFTEEWYYKLCDYKPTLAYLFPDLLEKKKYTYWGYGDMDLIWGNISRFSHWFQVTNQPFVITEYFGVSGQAVFFINEDWTKRLFLKDPMYVPLLANWSYHNLDEGGLAPKRVKDIIDAGKHSISEIVKRVIRDNPSIALNRGKIVQDRAFMELDDAHGWAGPAVWFRGTLKVLHGSSIFPPGRELMFYHRPYTRITIPRHIQEQVFEDMKVHGYLLPYWIPLLTRHQCRAAGGAEWGTRHLPLSNYRPFDPACFPKKRADGKSYRSGQKAKANKTVV